MNAAKHTPGPWASVSRDGIGEDGKPFVIHEIKPAGTNGWKDGRYMCVSGCIDEADARLIAAAPELLEALQALSDAADDSDGCQYGTLSARFVRDIASAAIAKATGQ